MRKYLELVQDSFTQEYFDKRYNYPYIAYSINEDKVMYSDINYFYIESLEDNNIVDLSSNTWLGLKSDKVEYSLDTKEWDKLANITSYTLNSEQKIYFRSTEEILKSDYNNHTQPLIITSGLYNAGGDISTIMFGRENVTELTVDNCLIDLFRHTKIVSAEKLILPATRLSFYCYGEMFFNCTFLEFAPKLPAEYMAEYCYNCMFSGCTSLKVAPKLPSLNLQPYCYAAMFYQCYSLNTAQDILPATELAESCYRSMFQDCQSLTIAPELPATVLAESCCQQMFSNCTSLTTVPELPATTLAKKCYFQMFWDCTSLNYIKCLAIDISAERCTESWAHNISPTGTFIKHPDMNNWTGDVNGIPSGWTRENAVL